MSFCCAAVYQVKAECLTPLRTGGTDNDPEQVLRRRDGRAFVQGASLAGAMRGWLEKQSGHAPADALFGSQKQAGRLTVSDALFDRETDQASRPRLHIDPVSGTGVSGEKFDMAHIRAGSALRFTLVWQGKPEQKRELETVEQLLRAIHTGAVRLGAQKANGFGRLSLRVLCRRFDLTKPGDRRAWLADDWALPETGRPWPQNDPAWSVLALPDAEKAQADAGQVRFKAEGRTNGILVKDAPVILPDQDGEARSYMPNLAENGTAILPGSSVKGAVRARAEYIARALGLDPAVAEHGFGRGAEDGDNGLPGQVRFEDCLLRGKKQKISRIRIDRFTGGVQRQGLFTEEPLSTGLTLSITAPEEPALCGLLVYALRDLGLGLYSLGSGWAIGRGQIELTAVQITAPGGRRAALQFDGQGGITLEDPDGLVKEWLNKLKEAPHA